MILVVVTVIAGGILFRQGLRVIRPGRAAVEDGVFGRNARGPIAPGPVLGWILAVSGFLMAAGPVAMLALLLWLMGR